MYLFMTNATTTKICCYLKKKSLFEKSEKRPLKKEQCQQDVDHLTLFKLHVKYFLHSYNKRRYLKVTLK